jgi:NADPH:quinone reductase
MKAIGASMYHPVSHPSCLVAFEVPDPAPGPLDLLVKVRAVAVNPVDTKRRATLGGTPQDPPRILGWDAAGTVEAVGADVSGFAPGDDVFYAGDLTRPGCNAALQAVDSRLVARMPVGWSFAESAALPLVTLTAWELLFERMGIDPAGGDAGKALLVINGAGGVGSAVIPLARRAGLRVVATASRAETREWCLGLGADAVINHREPLGPQCAALGHDSFPLIVNLVNTEAYWQTTGELIAPLGTLGLIVEPRVPLPLGDPFKAKCVRIAWEFMPARAKFRTPDMHEQGAILARVAALAAAGHFPKIHTRVFDRMTPETLREAHAAMEAGTAIGKWVLVNRAD